jgi:hypothetical protein
MSETAVAEAAAQTDGGEGATGDAGAEPWYSQYGAAEDDAKILGRYKDAGEAIKSIAHRERAFHDRIALPKADAKPEELQKAHRNILTKLGAPKEPAGYAAIIEAAKETVPEGLKDRLPDAFWDNCAKDAHELGYLPWQFERHLAMAVQHLDNGTKAEQDAKLERQDALEKTLKTRYGLKWQSHATNAELVASKLDEFLLQNPKALEGADGQPPKDAFSKLLQDGHHPALDAALDHLYDLLLSEGDGGPRRLGAKGDDAYSKAYNEAKGRWPKRGETVWADYAQRKTREAK